MTVNDVIGRIDDLKPNGFSPEVKIDWLSKLDLMIQNEIIDTHDGAGETKFTGYDYDNDTDTVLLAPPPFDTMYIRWLEAQIDLANSEYNGYNASITMFNTEWQSYASYYNRKHLPLSAGRFMF